MAPQEGAPVYRHINGHKIEVKYPCKIYWPDSGITKLELVDYYVGIAPLMFPYLKERPVTLHYFPRGIQDISFYKRDYSHPIPGLINTYPYEEISQDKTIDVPVIANEAGIVYLASKGCIEFHNWSSRITDIHHSDLAVFDMDISDIQNFPMVLQAALLLHDYLAEKGLQSFVKTSGGNGLHLYVPIKPVYTFQEVRDWVAGVGEVMKEKYPDIFSLPGKRNQTHDQEKVVVDYRQNTITRNTASVYTVRAKPGAPVSTPLSWDEVKAGKIRPQDFTIKTLPQRIQEKGDLFREMLLSSYKLPEIQ